MLGLLEHLLDNLLLLNQESTDNAVLDAVGASRSTVGALDGLLGAGNLGVLAGAEGGNTLELGTAVLGIVNSLSPNTVSISTYTALGGSALLLDVQVTELTTGSLDDADLLALGVVWRTSPLPIVSLKSQFSFFSNALSIARSSSRDCGATYVGESVGRHRDRFPGESVGNCLQLCERCRRGSAVARRQKPYLSLERKLVSKKNSGSRASMQLTTGVLCR